MIGAPAGRVAAAAAHALHDGLERHVDFKHVIEFDARLLHGLGLRNGAGKAVEQKAGRTVGLGNALFDQVDDEIVADQLARFHHGLGLLPQGRAGLDGGAQHVARRNLRDIEFARDELRLRAFARAGRAQKNQFHTGFLFVNDVEDECVKTRKS